MIYVRFIGLLFIFSLNIVLFQNCGEGFNAMGVPDSSIPDDHSLVGDMIVENKAILDNEDVKELGLDQAKNGWDEEDLAHYLEGVKGLRIKSWSRGEIPIRFDKKISKAQRKIFLRKCYEMGEVAQVSCVKYNGNQGDYVYVRFGKTPCGSSYLGNKGWNGQPLFIHRNCFTENGRTIQHELMHAFGVAHEHNHPLRDRYVNIHWGNLNKGANKQYVRVSYGLGSLGVIRTNYDFNSIMHYSSWSYSKNGKATMTRKNGASIFYNQQMTKYDHQILVKIYGPRTRPRVLKYF